MTYLAEPFPSFRDSDIKRLAELDRGGVFFPMMTCWNVSLPRLVIGWVQQNDITLLDLMLQRYQDGLHSLVVSHPEGTGIII